MKTAPLLAYALLGAIAAALETEETTESPVNFDDQFVQEEVVVDALAKFAGADKFDSFVHHLGTPAMHPEPEDGKSIVEHDFRITIGAIHSPA